MRILITGGLGFVGCNLIESLNVEGHNEIVVLDNESLGKKAHVTGLNAEVVVGDLRDGKLVDQLVSSADAIVHLAADTRVMDSIDNPKFNFDVNVIGSFNVFEAMRRHGKKRIVYASTGGAIIGEAQPPLHENMVPNPISPYGASKLFLEGYASAYRGSYGMLPIGMRFSNVYGPRSFHKGSVVAAFLKAYLAGERLTVYGDGEQSRDFIYVGDLSRVIIDALSHEKSGVYQLGSGVETSINQLLAVMSDVVGENVFERVDYLPARKGEITKTYCDIALARNTLGFNPKTNLASGLAATWDWFREQSKATQARH